MTYSNKPLVSIIIITKNQKHFLEKSLPMIFNQTLRDFEVIMVDNGSKDGALELMGKFPVKVIHLKKFGYALAHNTGIRASSGRYLVRLSGDVTPVNEHWLANLIKNFDDSSVAGVYSRWVLPEKVNLLEKTMMPIYWKLLGSKRRIHSRFHILAGQSAVVRRDLWERYPYNESVPICEDYDWARHFQGLGYKIVYEPESLVYHGHDEPIKKGLKRYYDETKAVGWDIHLKDTFLKLKERTKKVKEIIFENLNENPLVR
ncbi:MAG: glycosyltransferase [Patescibacteria group bacterium]|nr:glycosyltransferase [Patescibacteria group bacterium]